MTYRPHPGESHEWSLPIPQLAGARACRNCGQLFPGSRQKGPGTVRKARLSCVSGPRTAPRAKRRVPVPPGQSHPPNSGQMGG